jgi:8-oxo-dGDP phosphatase
VTHGFRVRGDEELHRGWRISLVRRTVVDPHGEEHEREVVTHPGAVGVVPVHDDGSVTLVRQYRAALDAEVLEIPAGVRDVDGEPEAVTAARELAEEVGLAAERLEHAVTFLNSPGFSDEAVDVFVARGLREVPHDRHGAEEEAMVIERMALDDALDAVAEGRITDAKTVIGLLWVDRERRGPRRGG